MTAAPTIDDPVAEFTELPPNAQQELLKLYAAMELMLPEERYACAATQADVAETLEALGALPLTHRVSIAVIQLLTAATLAERAADERSL
ncbi:hypothetical protein ABT304_21045 [Nocardioides sp. NPDC000445]|uniref:hypothetical protein n=1 Tax=Nocardioides sp. NPDC000445 TaxID=3154257 RepID=UPI003324092D